jgi:uracil-DNA glycosylase
VTSSELKPLLVGEAPSRRGDRYWMFPLSGPPAKVLCELAGIPAQPGGSTYGRWTWALYDVFETVNLIERFKDAEPWSAPRARDRARELAEVHAPLVAVLLGRKVAAAWGLADRPVGEWGPALPGGLPVPEVVCLPHPSGLNRTLNDPEVRALMGRGLVEATERARTYHERTVAAK